MSGLWRALSVYSLLATTVCVGLYWGTASLVSRAADEATFQDLERGFEGLSRLLDGNDTELPDRVAELIPYTPFRLSLLDPEGRVVVDSLKLEAASEDRPGSPETGRPEVVAARSQGAGTSIRFSTGSGEQMAFLARRLAGSRWVLRLGRAHSVNRSLLNRLRALFLIAGLVLLLGTGGMTLAARNRLLASEDLLHRWIQRIAGGEHPNRLPLPTTAPLGRTARKLESLSEKMRARIGSVEVERDHLSTVLSSMLEGVLVLDRRGRVTGCNRSFREIFHVQTRPDGKLPLEVMRVASVAEQIQTVLRSGEGTWDEIRHQGRIFRVHLTPVGSPSRGVMCVFNDISDLRRLEELRREFVSNVSHELKTPLTAIQGYAETLSSEFENDPLQEKFLSRIAHNSRQLSAMIGQMLKLARVETQETRLALERLDFRELVDELQAEFAESLRSKDLALDWSAPPDPHFLADRSYFFQVFRNLLENAIKYTESGNIGLRMERGEESWLFSVEDTGIGIPEQDLERIFERFYRVPTDPTRESGGSGIGLAIVKHLVQLHRGVVWAERRLDSGARISFTLPYPESGEAG